MMGSYQVHYSDSLSWVNAANGNTEQNIASVKRRTTMPKIRVSARERANPIALFWVFGHCVGERLLWRWCIAISFRFLAKITRDVFVGLNSKLFYGKLNN